MLNDRCLFIAVTGAQGVGKSTFCSNLVAALEKASAGKFLLLDDLRGRVAATKVPLGSASIPATIHAVWIAHLERENAAANRLVVLDRCVIDALAYTRVLTVSSALERRLFEQIARLMFPRLDLVVHLRLTQFFADKGASHETPKDRLAVAREIEEVVRTSGRPTLELSAEQADSVEKAVAAVQVALERKFAN